MKEFIKKLKSFYYSMGVWYIKCDCERELPLTKKNLIITNYINNSDIDVFICPNCCQRYKREAKKIKTIKEN
jgi:hypothetical protein